MSHASNIVLCDGPDSPHAFDVVPLQPRNGSLDAMCPVCKGRGQWNTEIDLVSFRCKRTACDLISKFRTLTPCFVVQVPLRCHFPLEFVSFTAV